MAESAENLLTDRAIQNELRPAWQESNPGIAGGREEGGFNVRNPADQLIVVRWQGGSQFSILVPPHNECRIDGMRIVASFHTHPNTGPDALQEPSDTDRRAVRDDPELKGRDYIGEFVISRETVYLITPGGQVSEMGDRNTILGQPE
jgi:hypothetical protein